MELEFYPQVGMTVRDCYMGGIGDYDNIGNKGKVECVGVDYCIVRDMERNQPIFLTTDNYPTLEHYVR